MADDGSGEDMDISQDEISDEEMKGEDDGPAGVVGAAVWPRWEGDINKLSTSLAAGDITYTLRREIWLVLRFSASSRFPALLDFLVNSAVVSSADTQLRLMDTILLQTNPAVTQRLQLGY
uniref:Uncharacterized protein n=1 Tax=Peronospora matthiolae TaxID=2874970 RepID=A0AAV1V1V1_9STRA